MGRGGGGAIPVTAAFEVPWWAWTLIWTGLAVALLIMLGLFAWWLFRKFMRLLDDLADLADRSALMQIDDPVLVKPKPAVLEDLRVIRERENARKSYRVALKRERHERRLARARRITSVDASKRDWPADWVS